MNLRIGKSSDLDSILRLLSQLGYPEGDRDHILRKINNPDSSFHLLVAEIDHRVVGFVSLHWFDRFHVASSMGRITAFCVDEQNRGQGIGTLMLRGAEEFLKKVGCSKIEVTSNQRRMRAHEFYLNHGYIEDSRRFAKTVG